MKKHLANLLLILTSTAFALVLFNALFPLLIQQSVFPRALLFHVGNFQSTYYPETFKRTELKNYTAILGDSYAGGDGDDFIDGKYDYSFAHKLHANTGRSYVTFARSGFCSSSSAKEILRVQSIAEKNPLLTNFNTPEDMYFFFYEGNDLNDNVRYLSYLRADEPEERKAEAKEDILSGSQLHMRDYLDAWLPFNGLIVGAYKLLRDGDNPILARPVCDACADHAAKLQHFATTVPLQSAAMELSEGKLGQALDLFFLSIDTLSESFPDTRITVVYLPSPVSSYPFEGTVKVQTYHNRVPFLEIEAVANQRRHEAIVKTMSVGLKDRGVDFLNTSAAIKAAGKSQFLHGSKDIKHFNAKANQIVADLVLDHEAQMTPKKITLKESVATIHIHDKFTVKRDVADFMGMAFSKGQRFEMDLRGEYEVADNKIRKITLSMP